MKLAVTTMKRDESPTMHATKTVAKLVAIFVLLIATIVVIYVAA